MASGNGQVAVVSGKWQERPTPRPEWSDNRGTGERQLARRASGQWQQRSLWHWCHKKAHKSREKCERKKHFDTKQQKVAASLRCLWTNWLCVKTRWLDDDYEYEKLMIVTAWQQLHAHTHTDSHTHTHSCQVWTKRIRMSRLSIRNVAHADSLAN